MIFMCACEIELGLLALRGFESVIWDRIYSQNDQIREGMYYYYSSVTDGETKV